MVSRTATKVEIRVKTDGGWRLITHQTTQINK
jgi:hypothetical protein